MNRIKNNLTREFTVVPNELINDRGVSPQARFLFVYMASKHDGWSFNNTDLAKAMCIKDDKTITKYLKELLFSGWIAREDGPRVGGRFTCYNYTLHATPSTKKQPTVEAPPSTVFSVTEKNRNGKNHPLSNKEYLVKKNIIEKKREAAPAKNENEESRTQPNSQSDLEKEKSSAKKEKARPVDAAEVQSFMSEYAEAKEMPAPARNEGEKFFDYYAAKGWKVGRSAMKDWQAAARGWLNRSAEFSRGKAQPDNRLHIPGYDGQDLAPRSMTL